MYERLEMRVPIDLWIPVAFEAPIFFTRNIDQEHRVYYKSYVFHWTERYLNMTTRYKCGNNSRVRDIGKLEVISNIIENYRSDIYEVHDD